MSQLDPQAFENVVAKFEADKRTTIRDNLKNMVLLPAIVLISIAFIAFNIPKGAVWDAVVGGFLQVILIASYFGVFMQMSDEHFYKGLPDVLKNTKGMMRKSLVDARYPVFIGINYLILFGSAFYAGWAMLAIVSVQMLFVETVIRRHFLLAMDTLQLRYVIDKHNKQM